MKNDIAEIRDIILGEEIEHWEQQIKALKQECSHLQEKLAIVESELAASKKLIAQNTEALKASQSINQRTQDVIDTLKREFEQKLSEIRETKVDRNQIGQAFIEWGIKVKQDAEK